MRSAFLTLVFATLLGIAAVHGQTPQPVVVPPAAAAPAPPGATTGTAAAVKALQEVKAANEETLRKQAATLQQLDELLKTAEQIRIYSKRS